jgi:hypothetical protein
LVKIGNFIIFIANSNIYDKILEIIIANSRNFDPKLEEKKNSKLLRLQTLKELGEKKYCKFEKTN